MIFIYTSFEYSNKATFFAIFMDLIAYGLSLAAIVCFFLTVKFGILMVPLGFLLIALAIFFYFFLGKKVGGAMAKKDFQKQIHTNPIVAYNYVNNGHATYEEMAAINPAFAAKYEVNQFGKLTRRKN